MPGPAVFAGPCGDGISRHHTVGLGLGVPDGPVHCRDQCLEGGRGGAGGVNSDTPQNAFSDSTFNVGRSTGTAAFGQGVLAVIEHPHVNAIVVEYVQQGCNGTIAMAGAADFDAVDPQVCVHGHGARFIRLGAHATQPIATPPLSLLFFGGQVFILEDLPQLGTADLATHGIGTTLDDSGELDLCPAGQIQVVLVLQQVGHAALAGLRVNPDNSFIAAAEVLGVDGQVGNLPGEVVNRLPGSSSVLLERLKALLDGILVRTGEGRKDEVATVGRRSGTGNWLQYSTVRRISSISEKSIMGGSTPCTNMLSPSVTKSTLPVRSPLPNKQPSMRSAPAR